MLTAGDREQIQARARAAIRTSTLRNDAWWLQPISAIAVLGLFVGYSTWSAIYGAAYYAHPYISPLYAPCVASNCEHQTFPLIGSWWKWSPALLIIVFPLGFRMTCYFYRRVTYRSALASPAACAVAEPVPFLMPKGESRRPFIVMNVHRYFLYMAMVLAVLHFYDLFLAFHFHEGWGIGLGTLLMAIDSVLLASYVFSCHSFRHLVGGSVNRFSAAPLRHKLWRASTKLNEKHGPIAWASLVIVIVVDLYVKGLASGLFNDPRIIFFS